MEPSDVPDANATVLYVGNLDRRVTDQMMLNILRTGLVHIKDKIHSASMFPPDMTNPEGYCFVQFEDNQAACSAMTFLNGRDFCGKKVKVNWATNAGTGGGIPKVIGTSVAIYVGNLDEDINENDLKAAFEPFGEILNVKVVRDPVTNKSKNIGFISFTSKPDAEKAIREMHGQMLKGRPIKTNWATRNQNQKKEELDYDEVYKGVPADNCTVYVGGIPNNVSDDVIKRHFEEYGKILDVRIFAAKNYAFIKFESHAAAATAICKTNGTELNGSCLKCWWGKDGPDSIGGGGSSNSNSSSNNTFTPQPHDSSQYNPYAAQHMTPQQQQQQYMMYMQYYQYWMQQYQHQMAAGQQPGGQPGYPYPGFPQQGYPQQNQQQQQQQQPQQQGYPPQSYQN